MLKEGCRRGRYRSPAAWRCRGTGAGHAGPGPSRERSGESESGAEGQGRRPPSRPRVRREYPDLVTREPAPDDEDVELMDSHSTQGRDLEWLAEKECLLTVEL